MIMNINSWIMINNFYNCGAFMTFEYDENLHKLLFKNNVINKSILIESIIANDFLGSNNNIEYSKTARDSMVSQHPL